MAQKPRFRFVIYRSSLLTKTVVIAMLIATTVATLALTLGIRKAVALYESYQGEAAQLEQKNAELVEDIEKADSVEGQKEIAGEELDLVDPDTVVYIPGN